jgi:hypothetical protein
MLVFSFAIGEMFDLAYEKESSLSRDTFTVISILTGACGSVYG